MRCSHCGNALAPHHQFCEACGTSRPQLPPTFAAAERRFAALQAQHAAGGLDDAAFDTALQDLVIQDDVGAFWMIGADTGQWYWHDGNQWVRRDPPPSTSEGPARMGDGGADAAGRGLLIVGAVTALLLLAMCVGAWLARDRLVGPNGVISGLIASRAIEPAVQATETARAATAQVRATATARVEATSVARMQATATAQGQLAATARARTTATAFAQGIATAQVEAAATIQAQQSATAQALATEQVVVAAATGTAQATTDAQATAQAQAAADAQATTQAVAAAQAQATAVAAAKTSTTVALAQRSPTPEPTKTPGHIVPSALSGRIAFPVFAPDRGTYDIYVANPDGSNMQRVLDYASQPALSPNGLRIAFRRWKSDDRGVEIMDTYGGNQHRLTNFLEDALPFWSPDGRTLVFFSRRESDRRPRVYEVDVTGGSDRVLLRGGGPVYGVFPTWMPNGPIIYVVTSPQNGLATMNADGSGFQMVFADGSATAPAVSPDGARIAFMSQRDGNWEVYRLNADGSGLVRLTNHGANDGLPAWSPDGSALAFVSDRDGSWGVWAVKPAGSQPVKLFTMPGSPDGHVRNEPDFSSHGWVEERISWGK